MEIPLDMRKSYLERRFAELEILKNLAFNPDFILIKKLGHQIKGNAKSFCFDDLTAVAIDFEKAAESKDLSSVLSAVNDFERFLNLYAQRLASEEAVSNE